jgi:hypothetical protein
MMETLPFTGRNVPDDPSEGADDAAGAPTRAAPEQPGG